jgi:hypothetical protein
MQAEDGPEILAFKGVKMFNDLESLFVQPLERFVATTV